MSNTAVICCPRSCIWSPVVGELSLGSRICLISVLPYLRPGLGEPGLADSVYRLGLRKYFGGMSEVGLTLLCGAVRRMVSRSLGFTALCLRHA